jgi:sortase A
MFLAGAALVYSGVRSLLLSRSNIPESPAFSTSPAPVPGEFCCTLEVPRLRTSVRILEGTRQEDLERAPGRFIRSATPGSNGNFAISAHRDTHFRFVRELRKGDRIRVTYRGKTFEYVVTARKVIRRSDVSILDQTAIPTLTLLTCYPFTYIGPAPNRFAVQAVLSSESPRNFSAKDSTQLATLSTSSK